MTYNENLLFYIYSELKAFQKNQFKKLQKYFILQRKNYSESDKIVIN